MTNKTIKNGNRIRSAKTILAIAGLPCDNKNFLVFPDEQQTLRALSKKVCTKIVVNFVHFSYSVINDVCQVFNN